MERPTSRRHLSTISAHLQKTTKTTSVLTFIPNLVLKIIVTVFFCVVLMVAACYLGHVKNFLIDIVTVVTVQQIFRSGIQPETPQCQQCLSCPSF